MAQKRSNQPGLAEIFTKQREGHGIAVPYENLPSRPLIGITSAGGAVAPRSDRACAIAL